MFESKVYECQSCKQFFFFKLDADDHQGRTGHSEFKVTDRQPLPPRINRGKSPL